MGSNAEGRGGANAPATGEVAPRAENGRRESDHAAGGGLKLPRLLLDRRTPDFPEVYAALLRHHRRLDLATWRIRLAGLHLPPTTLLHMEGIRVVVGELDGQRLAAEAEGMAVLARRVDTVRALLSLLLEGRLEIRSAPLGGWAPDFSLFRGGAGGAALLVGPHWLERPFPHRGPALASLHSGPEAMAVGRRFEELWLESHDVGPAILRMLSEAVSRSTGGSELDRARTSP
jgi:hypothetical protein